MKKYLIILFFITFSSFSQTFEETKKSAEAGDATAQFNLGEIYRRGEGTEKDLKEAFYWWKKSAEQGYAAAQYDLGVMYRNGDGTLKDPKKAFYWWKKSAEQGYAAAQYNLGVMYYNGEVFSEDLKKPSLEDLNEENSTTLIFDMLNHSDKVEAANRKQAAHWIRKAYENGFEEAKKFWEDNELWKYE